MKQSYFQTPRTTEECTFHSWADPIQVGQPNQNTGIDQITEWHIGGDKERAVDYVNAILGRTA